MLIFPNLPVNIVPEAIDLIAGTLAGVSKGLTQPIQYQSAILGLIGIGNDSGRKNLETEIKIIIEVVL